MLPPNYQKKSFLKFDQFINLELLQEEYFSIPDAAWESSYWGNIHCSVGMLLLRGGENGNEKDFFADSVTDKPPLQNLPYIKNLISEEGPFGKADFAFIFKMEPNGLALKHQDLMKKWESMYRIHIPIITNPGAYLISNDYSQHFSSGSAWSFDNQSDHGVVNGDQERIHLIIDVEFNSKLARAIDNASVLKGEKIQENIDAINQDNRAKPSYPGDQFLIRAIEHMKTRGATNKQIASFFNSKSVPSKSYPVEDWDSDMIKALYPD